ncbi:hypothetical protein E3O06_05130 [Cryobacterium glaciale]|uniref:Fibronectin type-III domain-containing protein n=1 Tax=Cryobacterium glaciale TaxID=1259145 RepID=A0A4R8V0T3_9MICO|nr:hypothetical protein E3O06_05130 [Cryobacterium glaciale]
MFRRTVGAAALSAPITGLTNGTAYTIHVNATSTAGPGSVGTGGPITPSPLPTTAPGAPTIGTATAGNTSATVNWTRPAGVVDSFTVTASTGGVVVRTIPLVSGTAGSAVISGLANGTPYTFTVTAVNIIGPSLPSAASNTVTPAVPVTVPGAPTIGTVTAGNASATIPWTAPANAATSAITGYRIQRFSGTGTTVLGTTTVGPTLRLATVSGLTNGTAVRFDVTAVTGTTFGAVSAKSVVVTPRTEFVLPTVIARTPASGARSVSTTGNLTATFSEPVTGVSGTTFVLRRGTLVVASVVSYNATTRVATLNPSVTLLTDRTYTATLSGIRDVAGNTMADSTWSFITGPAPTITTRTPAAGATGVRRNANVTALFSEDIIGVSASTVVITRVSTGAVVASAAAFNATTNVLTINPGVTLTSNVQYRVTIIGGNTSVRDLIGNPLVTSTWTFTTGALL